MHMRPTSKATTAGLGPAHCYYVQSIFNFAYALRKHMLRKQPQHAHNDTALARVGSDDAAALVATQLQPAHSQLYSGQQLQMHAFGGYGRVMTHLHSVNNAGTSHLHLLCRSFRRNLCSQRLCCQLC